MSSPLDSLPLPAALPSQSEATLTQILDLLFEPTPALHPMMLPTMTTTTFDSYAALIEVVRAQLMVLGRLAEESVDARAKLEEILAAHPRLGEKKVDSALSRMEQAQLQVGKGGAGNADDAAAQAEADELARLNAEYEEKFPGLRYV
jgi:2-oxo-4-hydroxy-4-carboxy--5-ureidoimidazoline (OHCU) decarboxylase